MHLLLMVQYTGDANSSVTTVLIFAYSCAYCMYAPECEASILGFLVTGWYVGETWVPLKGVSLLLERRRAVGIGDELHEMVKSHEHTDGLAWYHSSININMDVIV